MPGPPKVDLDNNSDIYVFIERVQVLFLAFNEDNNTDQGVLIWFAGTVNGAKVVGSNIVAKIKWDGGYHNKEVKIMTHTLTEK